MLKFSKQRIFKQARLYRGSPTKFFPCFCAVLRKVPKATYFSLTKKWGVNRIFWSEKNRKAERGSEGKMFSEIVVGEGCHGRGGGGQSQMWGKKTTEEILIFFQN